jgi:hypothetical protein
MISERCPLQVQILLLKTNQLTTQDRVPSVYGYVLVTPEGILFGNNEVIFRVARDIQGLSRFRVKVLSRVTKDFQGMTWLVGREFCFF